MASNADGMGTKRGNRMRWIVWGGAAGLLLLPAIAMQFSGSGVVWGPEDFIVMGAMLGLACGSYELVTRLSDRRAFRAGFGLAILTCFLLVWVNLAVGIIGSDDNPANQMYLAVIGIVIIGALVVRGRARGMMWVTALAATAQAVVAGIALGSGLGIEDPNWPLDLIGASGMFVLLWLGSSMLFRLAGRG